MACTFMIWRSWVRTQVGLNLGCVVLLSKPYLNQKSSEMIYMGTACKLSLLIISSSLSYLITNAIIIHHKTYKLHNYCNCFPHHTVIMQWWMIFCGDIRPLTFHSWARGRMEITLIVTHIVTHCNKNSIPWNPNILPSNWLKRRLLPL